ncbi:MAG: TfoX/Sxy family protein [Muribaculaceae bacterium]|nr:TfoX/Sxy family protein [Muribaculaceae bacterium]
MACSIEYIDYICEILAPLGEVRYRKMMGDYVIYVNGKCVITACDNCAYIKN